MPQPNPSPAGHPTDRLLGRSPAISALRAQIQHLAAFDTVGSPHAPTVLLQGETGTGKGLVARVIHDSGPRVQGPFIDVNCAAIPETLLEAELLGFEAGTFTDAKRAKPGLLEAASGGTVFLDEIEALPLALQSKFLTVIEEKWIRRLGAVRGQSVDVKIIAATTADLGGYAAQGRFRPDLYHRLAVVVVTLPPLHARAEDILLMAEHFLRRSAEAHGVRPNRLSRAAEAWLRGYGWPGNVRELSHLLERVTLLSQKGIVSPSTLESLCLPQPPAPMPAEPAAGVDESGRLEERMQIQAVLRQTRGNVVQAARLLGLSRGALRHRLRRYGLQRSRERAPSPAASGDQPATGVPATREAERAPERPTAPSPAWEHKPVAVLAIELTFPTATAGEAVAYEPWTAASRWEQALVAKVQGFGGVMLQRSPALLLVAFGIPRTLKQLPQRAVQAALALRHLVVEGADQAPGPALRLVVHWGEVLVDVQARDPTAQLRAFGETLAWPVRLLGQTGPGEIVLSPEMGPLVEGWCEVEAREVPLQGGQPGPIGVYAVVGNRPPWARRERQGRRPLSPFVGRDQELATLRERLRVEGGRGQGVGVIGDPGTGKSRLCDEFVRGALAQPWLILHTQGTAYGQATPYRPVLDLLKRYFHIDDREDRATIRDKVSTHLHSLDDTLTSTAPAFLTLLEVPVEDPQWQALAAAQRRQRTLDALRWVLVRESQVQPVLLICEDLHWIDTETQAFLDTLVESLPTAQLLLLVNYRPEYRHSWGHKTAYTQLRLDPLPPASADDLLRTLLGDDPSLAPLKPLLIERTNGNPFFLEESVQTLVETQGLVGERGAYRLTKAMPSLQVPATVQAVLAARIDQLPPEAKRLLQTAAVIGHEIPFPLLHTIAELSEDALHRGLAHLQVAEFLYETRLFPDRVYTFKHPLTQQVAYSCVVQDRRRALHASIVEALEALAGDRMAEQVERLAHHARRGEVWEKAVPYCREAGEKAQHRGAAREVVTNFEQALDALGHLPEHPGVGVLPIELYYRFGDVLSHAGEHQRSLALLGEAESRARQLDDRARLGGVLSRTMTVRTIVVDIDGAMAAGRQALELAARLGDPTLHVHAAYHLGQLSTLIGNYSGAAELLRGNVAALARSTPGDMRLFCVKSQAWLAEVLGLLGAFAEGRRHGEEALPLAMEDGQWLADAPILVRVRLGCLYLAQGDLDAAVQVFEEGLALCRTSGYRAPLGAIAGGLGEAYAHTGRLADGVALLEEARRDDLSTGELGSHYITHLRQLSVVYLLAGRVDEAWQHAYQALDLARQHRARGNAAFALCQLGAVQTHADPLDAEQAEAYYRQALALAEALGMRPLQAHCRLGLGKLYLKVGPLEQARSELSGALALFRSMDMTFWLPQAEAALGQSSG